MRALRAHVLTCFACLRAHIPTFLACLLAHVPMCFTCQRTLLSYMLTCQCVLRAYVRKYQRTFRTFCAYVPTCSQAITKNKNNKFSIICFPYIFVIVLSLFFLWNKIVIHCCIALTWGKSLTGTMADFVQKNEMIFVWA